MKHKTEVDNIYYGRVAKDWRFFDSDSTGYHVVGPIYPTKETLLADMHRYLTENWGME